MAEEIRQQQHAGDPIEKTAATGRGSRKAFDPTIYLLALVTVLVLSIAYFFVFALPKMQQDRLAWEKEKYSRQQQIAGSYESCVEAAEQEYEEYIKLNAAPVAGEAGAYSAPADVWEAADQRKRSALDDCSRRFGR